MSLHRSSRHDAVQIDQICDQFETEWQADFAQIERLISQHSKSRRDALMRELLLVDWELRTRRGLKPSIEQYLSYFGDYVECVLSALSTLHAQRREADAAKTVGADSDQDKSPQDQDTPESDFPQLGRYAIVRKLGDGAFGSVYEAIDTELARRVAIKIPGHAIDPRDLAGSVYEARQAVAAEVDGVVKIHNIDDSHSPPIIVMEYIAGGNLKAKIESGPIDVADAVQVTMALAKSLSHAHSKRIYHLDLKPANVLIDLRGRPFITDFGLAIEKSHLSRYDGISTGTPAYMSPEQVECEVNRFDATTDIWSLGVILYEMLTGTRPFDATIKSELSRQIHKASPLPPSEHRPEIPDAIDRICLKCMARYQLERYASMDELYDDLAWWQNRDAVAQREVEATPGTKNQLRLQGLRSFGAEHAGFFLSLLPGLRDREGLPESVSFWKRRIERMDSKSFPVGVIFGPSGCGKSSLVFAGIVPRLAEHVKVVEILCTGDHTERDVLAALRAEYPEHHGCRSIRELVVVLRDHAATPPRQKLLIVLNQFEQWLHAWGEHATDLVAALRHFDGMCIQALITVRADFFSTLSSFMRRIDVPLRDGWNMAGVEMFDKSHAAHVLDMFGDALGKFSQCPASVRRDFLRHVVDDIAQDGKIVCVRLVVIAEMMRNHDWSVETWRALGGAAGIGESFLEETFCSPQAPPHHRAHQDAARLVLAAMLPDEEVAIVGRSQTYQTLLNASEYERDVASFDQLLTLLDDEVRLITPVEHRAADGRVPFASPPPSERTYQLTHDFLVPSLRGWLTRKQRETAQGRAEVLLSQHTMWWTSRPEQRFLPSFWTWLRICRWTRRGRWSESERLMMGTAGRLFLSWGLLVAFVVALGVYGFSWQRRLGHQREVAANVDFLLRDGPVGRLPDRLNQVVHRASLFPYYRAALDAMEQAEINWRGHVLALVVEHGVVSHHRQAILDELPQMNLSSEMALASAVGRILPVERGLLREAMWRRVTAAEELGDEVVLLANLEPDADDPRWASVRNKIVQWLVHRPTISLESYLEALEPIAEQLVSPLATEVVRSALTSEGMESRTTESIHAAIALIAFAKPSDRGVVLDAAIRSSTSQLAELLRGDMRNVLRSRETQAELERISESWGKFMTPETDAWSLLSYRGGPSPSFRSGMDDCRVFVRDDSVRECLELRARAEGDDLRCVQRVDLAADRSYLLAARVKTQDVEFAEAGMFGAHLEIRDAPRPQSETIVATSSDWRYLWVYFPARSEPVTTQVMARLGSIGSTVRGTAWFDQLSLIELDDMEVELRTWEQADFLSRLDPQRNLLNDIRFASLVSSRQWANLRTLQAAQVGPLVESGVLEAFVADPVLREARSFLLERFELANPDATQIAEILRDAEQAPAVVQGLLLGLARLPQPRRTQSLIEITQKLASHPNAGIAKAAEWVVLQWGLPRPSVTPAKAAELVGQDADQPGQTWFRAPLCTPSPVHHDMVVFTQHVPYDVLGEQSANDLSSASHAYALCDREVTVQQFREFVAAMMQREINPYYPLQAEAELRHVQMQLHERSYAPTSQHPQIGVNWVQATMYCRWLSELEGVPEDQQWYPSLDELANLLQYDTSDGSNEPALAAINRLRQKPGGRRKFTGYRLCSVGEWIHASAAGSLSTRHFGSSNDLLPAYALYSADASHPVGTLKPNMFGLFDVLGNSWEFCEGLTGDFIVPMGGWFASPPDELRTVKFSREQPNFSYYYSGFRIARTVPREMLK